MSDPVSPISSLHPLPDRNTAEAIAYGPMYKRAMAAHWIWDGLEDTVNKKLKDLQASIIDTQFCARIWNQSPEQVERILQSPKPLFNDPRKLQDLVTLREILRCGCSLKTIAMYRTKGDMRYRIEGIDSYTQGLRATGVNELQWRMANIDLPDTIKYDTMRAIRDDDEAKSEEFVKQYEAVQQEIQRYKQMVKQQGAEPFEWEKEFQEEEPEPEDVLENVTIYEEAPVDAESPEYWDDSDDYDYEEEEDSSEEGHRRHSHSPEIVGFEEDPVAVQRRDFINMPLMNLVGPSLFSDNPMFPEVV